MFDVAIDFSLPEGFDPMLALCVERGAGLVYHRHLRHAAAGAGCSSGEDPVGLGVELQPGALDELVERAAQALAGWDCDIVESHHTQKKDAPSGTALTLGAPRSAPHYASLRAGDIVGEHLVQFTGLRRIELVHRATNRDIFARGALFAARQLPAPGSYRVRDLLAVVAAGRQPRDAPILPASGRHYRGAAARPH